jgi:hypothetical protein
VAASSTAKAIQHETCLTIMLMSCAAADLMHFASVQYTNDYVVLGVHVSSRMAKISRQAELRQRGKMLHKVCFLSCTHTYKLCTHG